MMGTTTHNTPPGLSAPPAGYADQAIKHNWSHKILVMEIETGLLERSGRSLTHFEASLPSIEKIERPLTGESDNAA